MCNYSSGIKKMKTAPKRYFCGHCDQSLSKTVFYQHRRLYYNAESKKWCKGRLFSVPTSEPSFTMPDDEFEQCTGSISTLFTISDEECDAEPLFSGNYPLGWDRALAA